MKVVAPVTLKGVSLVITPSDFRRSTRKPRMWTRRSLVVGRSHCAQLSQLVRPTLVDQNHAYSSKRAKYVSRYRVEKPEQPEVFVGPEPTKESTDIAGLEVIPNAREVLMELYKKTLEEFKTMPADAPYRVIMERSTRDRLKVLEENEKISEIERIIDTAQIEELIEMAQDELALIPFMNQHRFWEAPKNHRVVILEMP